MHRRDLSDAEWEVVEPLLPSERGCWWRPVGDNRRFLNGTWVEVPVQATTVQKLEDIILTKARDLRRRSAL